MLKCLWTAPIFKYYMDKRQQLLTVLSNGRDEDLLAIFHMNYALVILLSIQTNVYDEQ
jgi:hypothetical protein